jgi:hypothetical protein
MMANMLMRADEINILGTEGEKSTVDDEVGQLKTLQHYAKQT